MAMLESDTSPAFCKYAIALRAACLYATVLHPDFQQFTSSKVGALLTRPCYTVSRRRLYNGQLDKSRPKLK